MTGDVKKPLGFEFKVTDIEGRTTTLTHPDYELDYPGLLEFFVDFSIACGFTRKVIKEYLPDAEV